MQGNLIMDVPLGYDNFESEIVLTYHAQFCLTIFACPLLGCLEETKKTYIKSMLTIGWPQIDGLVQKTAVATVRY